MSRSMRIVSKMVSNITLISPAEVPCLKIFSNCFDSLEMTSHQKKIKRKVYHFGDMEPFSSKFSEVIQNDPMISCPSCTTMQIRFQPATSQPSLPRVRHMNFTPQMPATRWTRLGRDRWFRVKQIQGLHLGFTVPYGKHPANFDNTSEASQFLWIFQQLTNCFAKKKRTSCRKRMLE